MRYSGRCSDVLSIASGTRKVTLSCSVKKACEGAQRRQLPFCAGVSLPAHSGS
jgi:hypothetical protein